MSADNTKQELKDYADGWIQERKGTDAPGFLKLAYPIIGLSLIAYIVIYMNGEINHSERGEFVRQLNATTGTADVFMYIVTAMMLVFLAILLAFVYKKPHED